MKKEAGIVFKLFLVILLFWSCNSGEEEAYREFELEQKTIPPEVVQPGKFEVRFIDSLPPPRSVLLSRVSQPKREEADLHFSMQNFNTGDGLAMSSLLCGFKDRDGNLWFGTNGNGVSMYNGKKFITFSSRFGLIHNYIHTVSQAKNGDLWFGTYGGASRYDGVHFFNYTTEDGLIDNDVHEILEDSAGNIWFATTKGISKYDPKKEQFTNFGTESGLTNTFLDDIIEDSKNRLWFSGNGGVFLYDPVAETSGGKAFKSYSEALELQGAVVNELLEDSEGKLWIATESSAVRFDPETPEDSKHFTTKDGLVNDYVYSCTLDRNGNIWFGTKAGVSKYSPATDSFLNITPEHGLADNVVRNITEDKAGSLWFGTYGGGLNKFDSESVMEYRRMEGPSWKAVYAIAEDRNGELWFAPAEGGLVKFEPSKNTSQKRHFWNFSTRHGLPENTFLSMAEDHDGNMWFGSENGLCKYDGKSFTTFTEAQGLPDNDIDALSIDKNGNLWIGTFEGGVSVFNGSSFTNFNTGQGLVHKTVWDILEDKQGIIWIATRGGLTRYDGQQFLNFRQEQGLPDNKLSRVFQDSRGNLLIGTWGGGLSVIRKEKLQRLESEDPGKYEYSLFENFTTSNGLANDVVYTILEDGERNIILGTNLGFTVLKGGIQNGAEIGSGGIENYNEKNGFPIKDISNNFSMIKDREGKLWMGTGDKFLTFDFNKVLRDSLPPVLKIRNLKVKNKEVSWHSLAWARNKEEVQPAAGAPAFMANELLVFEKGLNQAARDTMINEFKKVAFSGIQPFYPVPEDLVLPYSQNDIELEFVGVETSRPWLVEYRYKLEDYDEDWTPVSTNNSASYGNLSEGVYTFYVKAKSPDGIWSKAVSYPLEIRPPWYRSWFAYVLYVFLFLVILYFVDRYQKKRVLFEARQEAIKRELLHAQEIEEAYKELKATQAQLIHAEKMASFGELTAGIAHEIQNPLNFVTNFTEVSKDLIEEVKTEIEKGNLEEARDLMQDIQQNLQIINTHGKRADSIVKGMLQHSRASTGQKESIDLNKLVEDSLRLAYHGFRNKHKSFQVDIEKNYAEDLQKVQVVPQDIGRVIINLFTNAFHAILMKQQTAPSHNGKYQPVVRVCTREHEGNAEIEVEDNGTGIPPHIQNKIFQPFFSTKASGEGTGLGLSLSSDIVRTHGGELLFETVEGEGTQFRIILPSNRQKLKAETRKGSGKE